MANKHTRTTCLGMFVSYLRVKFLRAKAILQKKNVLRIKRNLVQLAKLTHARHSTDRTFYKWPAAVLDHQGTCTHVY